MSTNSGPKSSGRIRRIATPLTIMTAGIAVASLLMGQHSLAAPDQQLALEPAAPTAPPGSTAVRHPDPGAQVHDTGKPLSFGPTTAATSRGGKDIRDAIAQVVRGMGGQQGPVRAIDVRADSNGPALRVHLAHSNDDVPDVWAADLTVGAVAELIHGGQTAMSQVISEAEAMGPGSNGPATWTGVGLGAVALGQSFDSPNDADLGARAEDVAQSFGLKLAGVQIFHPLDSAMQVTYVLPGGATPNWTIDDLRAALVGEPIDIEGILIELKSETGDSLVRSGMAYRTGEGGLFCAPAAQRLCGNDMTQTQLFPGIR